MLRRKRKQQDKKVVRIGDAKPKDVKETAIDKQNKRNSNISTTSDYSALNALQQRLATATGDEKMRLSLPT